MKPTRSWLLMVVIVAAGLYLGYALPLLREPINGMLPPTQLAIIPGDRGVWTCTYERTTTSVTHHAMHRTSDTPDEEKTP